ncbi:hypothetical protein BKA80DRAFT_274497 [Phyllosticta citrichinensis]
MLITFLCCSSQRAILSATCVPWPWPSWCSWWLTARALVAPQKPRGGSFCYSLLACSLLKGEAGCRVWAGCSN